jgi:hypothetical protein
MNPHDPAFWPAFFIVGVPLIVLTGGPYGWRFLTLLRALAALAYAPLRGHRALPAPNPAPLGRRGAGGAELKGRARGTRNFHNGRYYGIEAGLGD